MINLTKFIYSLVSLTIKHLFIGEFSHINSTHG
jgi:hypothetical protein